MLKERELVLIWMYSESNSGWNWNKAHFVGLKGESPKQGLYPLTDVQGLQYGVVKHLTFISIWSQRARGTYNEEEKVGDGMQLQRRRIKAGARRLSLSLNWVSWNRLESLYCPKWFIHQTQFNLSVNWTFACLASTDWKSWDHQRCWLLAASTTVNTSQNFTFTLMLFMFSYDFLRLAGFP